MNLLGAALAKIHVCTGNLNLYEKRLDEEYFIEKPLYAIYHYFGTDTVYAEVEAVAEVLREGYRRYENVSYGILHADPHNYNIHYTDGVPTLFDFDSFGYGPQMYDLGEQIWNISVFDNDYLSERAKKEQIK